MVQGMGTQQVMRFIAHAAVLTTASTGAGRS